MFDILEDRKDSYKISDIVLEGRTITTLLPDEDVIFILLFQGKNEDKKFKSILVEWRNLLNQSILNCINGDDSAEEMCTFVEFVIRKNYKIVFEPDDILLVDTSKAV